MAKYEPGRPVYRLLRNGVYYWVYIIRHHPDDEAQVLVESITGLFFYGWVWVYDLTPEPTR